LESGIASFQNGLSHLCNKLYIKSKDKILCRSKVNSIVKIGSYYELEVNGQRYQCENLILTIPAYDAVSLIKTFAPDRFLQALNNLNYPWLMVAQVLVPSVELKMKEKGFGFLQIPDAKSKVLGCLFSSHMFPQRVKKGYELFTCFVGGSKNPDYKDMEEQTLHSQIKEYLSIVLKIDNIAAMEILSKSWKKSIPQYDLQQNKFYSELQDYLKVENNLYFCSNYVSGVSLPDCIFNAKKMAETIQSDQ
ncbi:protoporphyrinogen oxidase, partial [bacterium]|nr:protoporphyrinogen oxidase [bacterium]